MKKLFLIVGCLIALVLGANAQNWQSFNLLTVPAVFSTSSIAITNLSTFYSVGTNIANTVYVGPTGTTNTVNSGLIATNPGARVNLLKDAPLWTRPQGLPPYTVLSNTSWANFTLGPEWYTVSDIAVVVDVHSAATTAFTIDFSPVWDGVNGDTQPGKTWTWSVTPAVGQNVISTNFPVAKFIGARAVRCNRIVGGANIKVNSLKLVGYKGVEQ